MDLAQQDTNTKEFLYYYANFLAVNSNCKRRKYGAILIKGNKILGKGYNHADECITCTRENCIHNEGSYDNCPAIHAEVDAINNAHINNIYDLKGAKLILVGIENNKKLDKVEPCHICKKILDDEGISY